MWKCVFGHSKFLGCVAILAVRPPASKLYWKVVRTLLHRFDRAWYALGAYIIYQVCRKYAQLSLRTPAHLLACFLPAYRRQVLYQYYTSIIPVIYQYYSSFILQ